jgi:hypothetical protein
VFVSSTLLCVNDGWDSLDGDLQLFLAIEGLLTGERKVCWKHERLDWDLHVEKLLHEDHFHIWLDQMVQLSGTRKLSDVEALVDLLGDAIVTDVVQPNRRCEEPIYPTDDEKLEIGGACHFHWERL